MVTFDYVTTFYILPKLTQSDLIISCDFLKEIQSTIDLGNNVLKFRKGNLPLTYAERIKINFMTDVPSHILADFEEIMSANAEAFADPNLPPQWRQQ